ncbi:C13 family peptidase [Sphingomonas crocodyli]|uniref:Peptidase C13 n=1 Tax=Sphingomonas crocodyli TaxID=1979270 RepID=A0A437LUJ8_9SPHN|nr:C13 family peptidase [Sphingomonas crocodyli]RVT89064.1 peptidase C13 [Sphingomonas crocodyli]
MIARLARLILLGAGLVLASPALPDQMSFGPMVQRAPSIGITDMDRRRLAAAADRLAPQRPGIADAYVVVAALDSDPVFGREAREAARVLARRYGADGRTLLLAGGDGRTIEALPRGSLETLETAINRVAAVMDRQEDALILYITAHGTPAGLAYREQGEFLATLPPTWLDYVLRHGRLRNRLVIISACFSGLFVPSLSTPEGAVITAAAADRTSFGCASDNDWTFFGDALINHALRKNQPLATAFGEAKGLVGSWEAKGKLIPSNPQIAIGAQAASWLRPIEARMPKEAGAPVGRPSIESIDLAIAANH